jgi:hypothetical protein
MEQYDVKEDILEKDLLTFTDALVENGLIELDDKC